MKASLFVTVFVAFVQYVQSQSQCVPEDGVTVSSTTHPKANGCYVFGDYNVLGHSHFIQNDGAIIWPTEYYSGSVDENGYGILEYRWFVAFENTPDDYIWCYTNSEPMGNPGKGGVEVTTCESGESLPLELSFSCGCSITPQPESDPTCEFGIIKNNICCAPECGVCGNFGCGSRGGEKCCGEPIIASGLSCDSNSAPCIISPPPIEIPQPDPSCSLGIIGSSILGMNICCPTECGICGQTGCGSVFPGSYAICCGSSILSSEVSCDDTNSPCIITMSPTPTTSTTPAPVIVTTASPLFSESDPTCEFGIIGNTAAGKDICCSDTCGLCGGIGCSLRLGGSQGCCGEVIRATGLSCHDHTSPCVIELP